MSLTIHVEMPKIFFLNRTMCLFKFGRVEIIEYSFQNQKVRYLQIYFRIRSCNKRIFVL